MERKNLVFQFSDMTSKTNSGRLSFDLEYDVISGQDYLVLPDEGEDIILEAIDQNLYDLTYTCLLLPRFGSHQLSGGIADCIQEVIEQVSVSFGWNLDFLQIDSSYLQWTVRVPPSIFTTYVVQIFRTHTSIRVFINFPQLGEEQDNDFWAPGYLVFLGAQHNPVEIIDRYIRQARQQQGMWLDE